MLPCAGRKQYGIGGGSVDSVPKGFCRTMIPARRVQHTLRHMLESRQAFCFVLMQLATNNADECRSIPMKPRPAVPVVQWALPQASSSSDRRVTCQKVVRTSALKAWNSQAMRARGEVLALYTSFAKPPKSAARCSRLLHVASRGAISVAMRAAGLVPNNTVSFVPRWHRAG